MADATFDFPNSGRFVDGEHRFAVRVYYEDTDAGGVVYHANYLRFMERARTDMLALAGADIVSALRDGEGAYVVASADLKYVRPAKLGDALIIVSRLEDVRKAACVVQQKVMRDDQILVDARLTVVFVGADWKPKRQPRAWMASFEGFKGA